MTEPTPVHRLRAVRDEIAEQTRKLPRRTANGHHDGGTSRFYVDIEPEAQELGYVDTSSRSYGERGDQPHEQVNHLKAATESPGAWSAEQGGPTPEAPAGTQETPTPRGPKPDPSQGAGHGGGVGDSPQRAQKEGRWLDALRMTNQDLRDRMTR